MAGKQAVEARGAYGRQPPYGSTGLGLAEEIMIMIMFML